MIHTLILKVTIFQKFTMNYNADMMQFCL